MIDKLLITCLQRGKRLIIPDLGAFLKKHVEGVGVTLVFVPFLNRDDGVLTGAVRQWAGVDEEDAKEIVSEYVRLIRHALDTRGKYIIEGLGVLKYDVNGVIYLTKGEPADRVKAQAPAAPVPTAPGGEEKEAVLSPRGENPETPAEKERVEAPVLPDCEAPAEEGRAVEAVASKAVETAKSEAPRERVVERVVERVIERAPRPAELSASAETAGIHRAEEDKPRSPKEIGARYFTPEKQPEGDAPASQPAQENAPAPIPGGSRKNAIHTLYGQSRPGNGAIYGSAAVGGNHHPQAQPVRTPGGTGMQPRGTLADKLAASGAHATVPPVPGKDAALPGTVPNAAGGRVGGAYASRSGSPYGAAAAQGGIRTRSGKRNSGNLFLVIAILVALLAIGVMVYGYIFGNDGMNGLQEEVQIENAQPGTADEGNGLPDPGVDLSL